MRLLTLALFIVVVLGLGSLIGYTTSPGQWYASLEKPWFNPPDWVFSPVWSILYVLIAIAGWRIFERDRSGPAMKIWLAQMALNFLWSPVFFAAQQPGWALLVILAMLAAILVFIAATWSRDRLSALLFLPYAAWVAFATLLNASIWLLN